jgi:hypothetical protein
MVVIERYSDSKRSYNGSGVWTGGCAWEVFQAGDARDLKLRKGLPRPYMFGFHSLEKFPFRKPHESKAWILCLIEHKENKY